MKANMTIREIEALTYEQAKEIAIEEMKIKDHDCIFADLGDFGYSVLVFKNNHHIYYVNDYELHHGYMVKEKGIEALRNWYITEMNNRLFTEEELLSKIKSYKEYYSKSYYLRNYWIMQFDYLSCFYISNKKSDEEFEEKKKNYPFFNPLSFCYVKDEDIIKKQITFKNHIEMEFDKLKNDENVFREMISYELVNHEACITCDYTEALSSLGVKYCELTETQKRIVNEELNKQIRNYGY